MWKLCKLAAGLVLALASLQALAAADKVEFFDAHSWQALQQQLPRPAAVVFSSTDCAHCPATISAIAAQLKNHTQHIALIVVLMDGEGQPDLLQQSYQPANRLFIFKGNGAALQYSVSPKWRGMTPYVALLSRAGEIKMFLGKPSSQELADWLAPEEKTQ